MQKVLGIFFIVCVGVGSLEAQKNHYLVDDHSAIKQVQFVLKSPSGVCNIMPTHCTSLINVYEKPGNENAQSLFSQTIWKGTQFVSLSLDEQGGQNVSSVLTSRVFNSSDKSNTGICNIFITPNKPIFLDLNYGMGEANIDLSGLAIDRLFIRTGSAHVKVTCLSGKPNLVVMDTLFVRVDMGELQLDHASLARAENIIAEVGFGNLFLDFSNPTTQGSQIVAKVGAGQLQVVLPSSDKAVIIRIANSPLCSVIIPEGYTRSYKNTFVSESYSSESTDALEFNVGVTLGGIAFITK